MTESMKKRVDFKAGVLAALALGLLMAMDVAAGEATSGPATGPAVKTLKHTYGPRVRLHEFQSVTLGEKKRFAVVLPANYDAAKGDWPVLLLMHGLGRNEQTLLKDETTRATLLSAPFVIVLPQGSDSWYVDSPVTNKKYQTYIGEVLAVARQQYGLSARRQRCGIAGWSMGGFGAMRIAETHADQFAAVATIIGLLNFPQEGTAFDRLFPYRVLGKDKTFWESVNPLPKAANVKGMAVLLVTGDKAGDKPMNEAFHQRLTELNIPHEYRVLEGGHSFGVIQRALPIVMDFMAKNIAPDAAGVTTQPATAPK